MIIRDQLGVHIKGTLPIDHDRSAKYVSLVVRRYNVAANKLRSLSNSILLLPSLATTILSVAVLQQA